MLSKRVLNTGYSWHMHTHFYFFCSLFDSYTFNVFNPSTPLKHMFCWLKVTSSPNFQELNFGKAA